MLGRPSFETLGQNAPATKKVDLLMAAVNGMGQAPLKDECPWVAGEIARQMTRLQLAVAEGEMGEGDPQKGRPFSLATVSEMADLASQTDDHLTLADAVEGR